MILFFLLFFNLYQSFLPATKKEKASAAKPNIIIILADDLGYADLGCFGSKDMRTPNLDALAKAGMRFTNFHTNSSVCSPTRAALLTGRYPDLVGVPGVIRSDKKNSWGYLAPTAQLLPQVLKNNGYHTALVGKWHLGLEAPNLPNLRGFTYFHGFLGDMMDDYYHHLRYNINYLRLNEAEIQPTGHATDLFSDWAATYIQSRTKTQEPFFLYLAYNAPHDPVQPPTDWLTRVKAREPEMPEKRAKLVALIEHMDAGIGKVLTVLRKSGQANNTLIMFMSDNGGRRDLGANNGATRSGKGSMYEGGLKVPALVVYPGRVKPGSLSNENLLTMDVFPTLLDAAGISYAPTATLDGKSFFSVLQGQTFTAANRPVFFSRREGDLEYGGKMIEAVQSGNYKLLQNNPFAPRELYNLQQDPEEKSNLITQNVDDYKKMELLLREHIQRRGQVPWQAPGE